MSLSDEEFAERIKDAADKLKLAIEKVAAMEALLRESAELFRFYEDSHRKRGPEHLAKAERNADIACRIEKVLAT